MSLVDFQRQRIGAALRLLLRAAAGRDPGAAEVSSRTAAYLVPRRRGLGPGDPVPTTSPLFLAADYAPKADTDPLGGPDGRDLSRAWAAVREDLDTAGDALTEYERRLTQSLRVIRSLGADLDSTLTALDLDTTSLDAQLQNLFSGGAASAAGQGRQVWALSAGSDLVSPETTAVLAAPDLAALPSPGRPIDDANGQGGALVPLTLTASSDPATLASASARAWAESPLAGTAGWTFSAPGPVWARVRCGGPDPVSALQVSLSSGTTVTGLSLASTGAPVPFTRLPSGGQIWLILHDALSPGQEFVLTLTGPAPDTTTASTAPGPAVLSGTVSGLRAHAFSFNPSADLVWGPFTPAGDAGADAPLAVTLESAVQAVPRGAAVRWQVSTFSADGPWTDLPPVGRPLALGSGGRTESDLVPSAAVPDTQSLGYFRFPLSNIGSLTGGQLWAGDGQAKVEAFPYRWEAEQDIAHQVSPADWVTPNGVIQTVAMGPGPTFQGDTGGQGFSAASYTQQGTCLARYQDRLGADLTYLCLRGGDNRPVLQPGYNYRFTYGIWAAAGASLTDVPVGVFNPNGAPAVYGVPLLVTLNGRSVFRTNTTFSDFRELSPAALGYGSTVTEYSASSSSGTRSYQGQGAPWPPHCGRMTLALTPGWNTLSLYVYVPSGDPTVGANLSPWAGIVFGPSVFADPAALYQTTGVQIVRGWPSPWTQLSEFDLRANCPVGLREVWAWQTDPSTATITGLLLNHDPGGPETGSSSLDGVLSGQTRTHHLSYLPQSAGLEGALSAGQDPLARELWVRARMTSGQTDTGPFVSGFTLSTN